MTAAPTATPGPYASAAGAYWAAGWRGILPLPRGQKWPPPDGWTGADAPWPSYADLDAWATGPEGAGNVALRLPEHVIGLDVDDYGDKNGAATLAAAVERWGALPPTWTVTSRDGASGIRLYRIPPGLAWPGDLRRLAGPGVDLIQYRHRYVVTWPSTHPDTGRVYVWRRPDGVAAVGEVPQVDELPDLPAEWVQGITAGAAEQHRPRVDLDAAGCGAWLSAAGAGDECRAVTRAADRALGEIGSAAGSRHEIGLAVTARLCLLASEGHTGALVALRRVFAGWLAAVAPDRGEQAARGEWGRMIDGAVQQAAARPETLRAHGDPCRSALHGGGSLARGGTVIGSPVLPPAPPAFVPPARPLAPPTAVTGPVGPTTGSLAVVPDVPAEPERQRSSWAPVDLVAVLDGDGPPPATLLRRQDGARAWYAGRVNGLIGESESGKTWLALLGVAQVILNGGSVLYLDFEDDAAGWTSRLAALGIDVRAAYAAGQIAYAAPDEGMTLDAVADLSEAMTTVAPELAVVDGVNAAMTLMGLSINDNNDATRFTQVLLKPLAATGAAVVYVDHVPKVREDKTKGGIGAQAKRAMTTGCALMVEVVKPFGRGQSGALRLTVDKDRPGHVRGASRGAKHFGLARLDSDPADGTVTLRIEPDGSPAPGETPSEAPDAPFRPTVLMRRVSDFLTLQPGPISRNKIISAVRGRRAMVLAAVDRLMIEGFAADEGAGIRLVRPFVETIDDGGDDDD